MVCVRGSQGCVWGGIQQPLSWGKERSLLLRMKTKQLSRRHGSKEIRQLLSMRVFLECPSYRNTPRKGRLLSFGAGLLPGGVRWDRETRPLETNQQLADVPQAGEAPPRGTACTP